MRIAVCIKQVPEGSEGMMDAERGVLIREGMRSIINVYDASALETALRLKEMLGGRVDVFTMGPPSAQKVIIDAFAMGSDNGFLISDKRFSGADVLATSYTLSQAFKTVSDYDVILCGKQTTDGDTGQVGAAISAHLNITYAGNISSLESADESSIKVWQNLESKRCLISVNYPCVLSVEREIFVPRIPSLKLKMLASHKTIKIIELKDLKDNDESHYGLNGSPTRVEKIFAPQKTQHKPIVTGDPDEIALKLYRYIESIN